MNGIDVGGTIHHLGEGQKEEDVFFCVEVSCLLGASFIASFCAMVEVSIVRQKSTQPMLRTPSAVFFASALVTSNRELNTTCSFTGASSQLPT